MTGYRALPGALNLSRSLSNVPRNRKGSSSCAKTRSRTGLYLRPTYHMRAKVGFNSVAAKGLFTTKATALRDTIHMHPTTEYKAATVRAPDFERYSNQRLPQAGAERFTQTYSLPRGLTQVLETLPSSAVMEERSRLAREIHDTLVQEFAGILLHLEAVEGSDNAEWRSSSECLARARDLARSGLEDARRMLLNLRPKSLENATLPDALRQLAEGFSCDCTITCTFCHAGHMRGLPVVIQDELYRRGAGSPVQRAQALARN